MRPTFTAKLPTLDTMLLLCFCIMLFNSCNKEDIFIEKELLQEEEEVETSEEEEIGDNVFVAELVDDFFTTPENTPVAIDPYANDGEINQDILLSYTDPANGTLSIVGETIEYAPNADFVGDDTFEYQVCDAATGETCFTATVTITVTEVVEDNVATELKAFPSAFGAASGTVGGRGGRIIHVTNLNDSGPGSFREAVDASGPRIVVFDVSGEIVMNGDITIYNGNLTIAGQTAPLGGITLKGHRFKIEDSADDVVVRYLRFRQDRTNGGSSSTLVGTYSPSNVIFDHCSLAYGRDETMLIWDDLTKAGPHTIQRCIFAEGKTAIILGSGVDAARAGNADKYTLHHNLISHMHRTPNTAGNGQFEIFNNVIYNWKIRLGSSFNEGQVNHQNNYYKPGRLTRSNAPGYYADELNKVNFFSGKIFTNGNIYEGIPDLNNNNALAWRNWGLNGSPVDASVLADSPQQQLGEFPLPLESANDAFNSVISDVGANASLNADGTVTKWLDENDTVYISDTENGTDSFSVDQGNGWQPRWYATNPSLTLNFPVIPENTRPADYDTDNDGMADVWESASFRSLDRDGSGDFDGDGYTDIEEFLNMVDLQ